MKKRILLVFISALMALSAGCASGGKAELPVYDTLDGHFDKTLMSKNELMDRIKRGTNRA